MKKQKKNNGYILQLNRFSKGKFSIAAESAPSSSIQFTDQLSIRNWNFKYINLIIKFLAECQQISPEQTTVHPLSFNMRNKLHITFLAVSWSYCSPTILIHGLCDILNS
uniref:Uncharacterized protein n=1 Tax=Romanomermis culicivorax TaxID=13658 RepID=A0A915HRJ0_ROMCU